MACPTCKGLGLPTGCGYCGKVGYFRKKKKRAIKKENPVLDWLREQIRDCKRQGGSEEELRELNKALVEAATADDAGESKREKQLQTIKELWAEATTENWEESRRNYIALLKKIKRKENIFHTGNN